MKQNTIILSENDTFAVYRLPYSNDVTLIKQVKKDLSEFKNFLFRNKGFAFFPFDKNLNPPIFITADEIYKNANFRFKIKKSLVSSDISKKEYIEKVAFFIDRIKSEYRKIVLSRTKTINNINIDIHLLFSELESNYKNAFVFLVNHPLSGTWIGATPETLLSKTDENCSTIALAGTQFVTNFSNVKWLHKEIEEQKAVMDYIENIFKKNNISFKSTEPYTKVAAKINDKNLVHLATEYTFKAPCDINNFIKSLHPTPAVSGFPKQKSMDFINRYEGYNREYYTGFLGPVNIESPDSMSLFVNLRSMKAYKNKFQLFLGGGLNSESIPEKEWEETENKAKTLEKVIESIQK